MGTNPARGSTTPFCLRFYIDSKQQLFKDRLPFFKHDLFT